MSEEKSKQKGPSPFDFAKAILNGKEQIPLNSSYSQFLVTRSVAHNRDIIYACQLINECGSLTDEEHYEYLYHVIPKQKRPFVPWVHQKGVESHSDVQLVANYYQCSMDVAAQYIALMSKEDLANIKAAYGGKS